MLFAAASLALAALSIVPKGTYAIDAISIYVQTPLLTDLFEDEC